MVDQDVVTSRTCWISLAANVAMGVLGRRTFLGNWVPTAKEVPGPFVLTCALGQVIAEVIHAAYGVRDIAIAIVAYVLRVVDPQFGVDGDGHNRPDH